MKAKIDAILAEIDGLKDLKEQEVEAARVRLLGKKGEITQLFDEFRSVAPEMKREFGQKLNQLKQTATAKIEELKEAAASQQSASAPSFDCTLPGDPVALHDSLMVVINGLQTVTTTQKLILGATNLAKLTDAEKKVATDKGWTLA